MAQTTRSSSKRTTRNSSGSTKRTNRNGSSRTSARSRTKRSSSNGAGASASRRARSQSRTQTSTATKAARGAGSTISSIVSKAKTPLVAAGAAVAGIAGGVALKNRNDSRSPLKKLRAPSMPKSLKNMDLGKVDLDAIMSAAREVRSIGEQVGDVADAAEKTRKKHK